MNRHNGSMPETLLPLFPLPLVLFPRTPLPLHIFEPRYRKLVAECLDSKSEFGIVQASDRGVANTGCTASIERVIKRYDDGRMDIITLGRRRFELLRLNDDLEYLRGEVQYFSDDDPEQASSDLKQRALDAYQTLSELDEDEELPEADEEDDQLSFLLAQPVQDLQFRQVLLGLKSESARLKQLIEFIPTYVSKQQRITHVKEVAPRNGHSTWPSNL